MSSFRAICDEFYITARLFLKLELNPSRETILHFFDRITQCAHISCRNDERIICIQMRRNTACIRADRRDARCHGFGNDQTERIVIATGENQAINGTIEFSYIVDIVLEVVRCVAQFFLE